MGSDYKGYTSFLCFLANPKCHRPPQKHCPPPQTPGLKASVPSTDPSIISLPCSRGGGVSAGGVSVGGVSGGGGGGWGSVQAELASADQVRARVGSAL